MSNDKSAAPAADVGGLTKQRIIALAVASGFDVDTDGDIWGSENGALLKFAALLAKVQESEAVAPASQPCAAISADDLDKLEALARKLANLNQLNPSHISLIHEVGHGALALIATARRSTIPAGYAVVPVEPIPEEKASGAVYGIIDPDYGRIYTMVRKLAWEEGYAIGLHGSFTRDLDLIAVPWAEKRCDPAHLVRRIIAATGLKDAHPDSDGKPGQKPHGRLVWTLVFPTFGDPRFVDLSIMPAAAPQVEQTQPAGDMSPCKTCGGTGMVDDGEIDCYPNGGTFMNGPVKCVKDCPDCDAASRCRAQGGNTCNELASAGSMEAGKDGRDAARYRWLRDRANHTHCRAPMVFDCDVSDDMPWDWSLHGSSLDCRIDAFIDAAIAQSTTKGEN